MIMIAITFNQSHILALVPTLCVETSAFLSVAAFK